MRQELKPQPGPQTSFLKTCADIAFYGGSAGSGKTWSLLAEPLRHYNNRKFKGVIFRRTVPDIRKQGALLDESKSLYFPLAGTLNESQLIWNFPTGMTMQLSHMQLEKNMYDWQGAQVSFIGWDEVTHFSKAQFFYLLGRNRSSAGVSGYVRATCNPDPDSWVAEFISWWINQTTGYPIKERSGVIRHFLRAPDDSFVWEDTAKKCIDKYIKLYQKPKDTLSPKSVTFIPANIYDNKILMEIDPSYLSNLDALPLVERERLKHGNWKIKPSAGLLFKREWFPILKTKPTNFKRIIRYWDRAATEKKPDNDPDWTVGLKAGIDHDGVITVLDVARFQEGPFKVQSNIKNTASQDGINVEVWLQHDPGQAGKVEAAHLVKELIGFNVKLDPVPKSNKETRALPASAQAEQGNIKLVQGNWNDTLLTELQGFPKLKHDDQVDCLSGAVQVFAENIVGEWTSDMIQNNSTSLTNTISNRNDW
jgi:predicted phage terminase large subunit-like protein